MPSPFISVIYFRKEGMIQSPHRSHAKKPESGLLSDWIGINTDDLRCSAVSCCWFQSAFFLASWAVNTYASSLWNFCQLSSLEFEECLNQSGPQPDLDIWWRHPHLQNGAYAEKHEGVKQPNTRVFQLKEMPDKEQNIEKKKVSVIFWTFGKNFFEIYIKFACW